MSLHALVRFLAPLVGAGLALHVFFFAVGSELMRSLTALLVFAVAAWIGDVVWKARASPEEIRRDLQDRADGEG